MLVNELDKDLLDRLVNISPTKDEVKKLLVDLQNWINEYGVENLDNWQICMLMQAYINFNMKFYHACKSAIGLAIIEDVNSVSQEQWHLDQLKSTAKDVDLNDILKKLVN